MAVFKMLLVVSHHHRFGNLSPVCTVSAVVDWNTKAQRSKGVKQHFHICHMSIILDLINRWSIFQALRGGWTCSRICAGDVPPS